MSFVSRLFSSYFKPILIMPEDKWTTCCSKSEANFIRYCVQVTFGLLLCIFCMVQIAREVENIAVFCSMLSGTVGLFLPHPQVHPATPRTRRTSTSVAVEKQSDVTTNVLV